MKRSFFTCLLWLPVWALSQGGLGIGVKAGLNFANITNASEINSSSRSGFLAGLFLAPQNKGVLTSRHEILFSRQGYSFQSGTNTGHVDLDYLILPQLMGINITKFVQIQLGMQMAFLLNAKADSSSGNGGSMGSYGSLLNYYNKVDYAVGGGIEIHPVKGLLVGARYNLGLGKLYKDAMSGQAPSFSSIDAKSNVIQVFAGWIFSKPNHDHHKKDKQ